MRIITGPGSGAGADPGADPGSAVPWGYTEHLRTPDLSFGTYRIPAGGVDDQSPHTEDEVYVVTAGRARIVTPTGEADLAPGNAVFVPAGEEHRFVDVTADFTVLVFFGPAEGTRG